MILCVIRDLLFVEISCSVQWLLVSSMSHKYPLFSLLVLGCNDRYGYKEAIAQEGYCQTYNASNFSCGSVPLNVTMPLPIISII